MKAMLLTRIVDLQREERPLELTELADPVPSDGELLLQVSTCGVCHTELDEIEGRTPPPRLPVILGHQVVGRVLAAGPGASSYPIGERLGVAWIYSACGKCPRCWRATRTCARSSAPPGATPMAATPNGWSYQLALPTRSQRPSATSRQPRCCAPARSAIARCV